MSISKSEYNQLRGRMNRAQGASFEREIEDALEWYRANGLAFVEKTPEPFKPIGGRQQIRGQWAFPCIPSKKAQPDFKGTLKGGKCICFDAKSTMEDRIKWDAVTPEQRDALDLHKRLGAVACIVVCLQLKDFYRVPWEVWRDMKGCFGHKYMDRKDLEEFRIGYEKLHLGVLKGLVE